MKIALYMALALCVLLVAIGVWVWYLPLPRFMRAVLSALAIFAGLAHAAIIIEELKDWR